MVAMELLLTLAVYAGCGLGMGSASAGLDVKLVSVRGSYVLGDPVVLNVTLTNGTTGPIRMFEVFVENTEPEIHVYISRNGEDFEIWELGILGVVKAEREIRLLQPNDFKRYRLRILYDSERQTHLAFDRPGRYWVKVVFPMMPRA